MSDLLGQLFDPNSGVIPDSQRKKLLRRSAKGLLRGHAWQPGTGPQGETCKSCKHYTVKYLSKAYRKCGLMREHWTGGAGSDIRASDPACKKWEAAE
jgi:hypothetical protein